MNEETYREIACERWPFRLRELDYPYDAIEPYIDAETMKLHHTRHLADYVKALNEVLSDYSQYQILSLRELVTSSERLPSAIRSNVKFNAGGIFSHNIYFSNLSPDFAGFADDRLIGDILRNYGAYDNFKRVFTSCASELQGSGWVWLVRDRRGRCSVIPTQRHDVPGLSVYTPLVVLDIWEHACYLKRRNRRDEYIDAWFEYMER